jgi:hypothetical protein
VLLALDGAAAVDEAGALLAQAATLSAQSGARRQEPILAAERARIAHLRGDRTGRDAALAEARRLYTDLDLPQLAARTTA